VSWNARLVQQLDEALRYCRDHLLLAEAPDHDTVRSTFWPANGESQSSTAFAK
jgi:hypothetical protein